jgi:predicted esterase
MSVVRRCGLGVAATMWSAVVHPCAGQVPSGTLTERVTSVGDSSQTYALYLPPGYPANKRWPILFVLDPRGRALLALKLFQEGAARHGWIVMSSYNSLSDGPPEPNLNAMEAMLRSAQERLSIDGSRLYLAGFSGTARAVLRFAVTLRGHVAGVVASGGALGFELGGPETVFAGDSAFAFFGAAGTRDFNYEEMLSMSERFGTTRVPFRFVAFEGPHSWPPDTICSEAIDWLELRAMRGRLRAVDSAWVLDRLAGELARAADLERHGQWARALRLYQAIARDYAGWPKSSDAATHADALRNRPEIKRYNQEAQRLAARDLQQAGDLQKILQWARSQRQAPAPETLIRKLRIPELQQDVARADSLRAASAARLLARIFAWLAFYEPRSYLANGAADRALSMFAAAIRIGRIQGESCGLLESALRSATAEQQAALGGQCAGD